MENPVFRPRFLVGILASAAVISTAGLQEKAPTSVTVGPRQQEIIRGALSKDVLISAASDGTTAVAVHFEPESSGKLPHFSDTPWRTRVR